MKFLSDPVNVMLAIGFVVLCLSVYFLLCLSVYFSGEYEKNKEKRRKNLLKNKSL